MKSPPDLHYRHRFPAEIISQAVWLYHVFSLSLRDVELLLAERGIVVPNESIRQWCKKFGQAFAGRLRRRRPPPGDKWHMDEVFIRIGGVQHYLWRAVDQEGVVLDILVQRRRDGNAAKRFFRRLNSGIRKPLERAWTRSRYPDPISGCAAINQKLRKSVGDQTKMPAGGLNISWSHDSGPALPPNMGVRNRGRHLDDQNKSRSVGHG